MLLRHLLDDDLSKTAIAERLGVSRRVIHHWLATGQLDRDLEAAPPRVARPRATKLDAYHGIIAERLDVYHELSAGSPKGGIHGALRNNRRLQAAMRSSRLPVVKTLEHFDFSFQPSVKREQIESLHTLGFIERKENVVFLGPPGVGKTHLAISLAIAAAESGRRRAGSCTA